MTPGGQGFVRLPTGFFHIKMARILSKGSFATYGSLSLLCAKPYGL